MKQGHLLLDKEVMILLQKVHLCNGWHVIFLVFLLAGMSRQIVSPDASQCLTNFLPEENMLYLLTSVALIKIINYPSLLVLLNIWEHSAGNKTRYSSCSWPTKKVGKEASKKNKYFCMLHAKQTSQK